MNLLELGVALAGIAVAGPALLLLVEVVASRLPPRREQRRPADRPAVAVVIPAHNEERAIASTLRSIGEQLRRGDRLVVVADNCSDSTARVAEAEGAEVIQREDCQRKGKGFALDFAVRHLEARPPQVVVFIDADCMVAPGAIDRLAGEAVAQERPIQALYEMQSESLATLKHRISAFAWIVKNRARPMGLARLGLPCQLMGTGMAFPWMLIERMHLATGHIVEDMALGLKMAEAGRAPLFCPQAVVKSAFPLTDGALKTQRTRWEHGHLSIVAKAPILVVRGVVRRNPHLALLALDLCIPPLALLSVVAVVVAAVSVVAAMTGSSSLLALGAAPLALLVPTVLIAWDSDGREVISLSDLTRIPAYLWWKLPIYVRFAARRETRWIRSERDHE